MRICALVLAIAAVPLTVAAGAAAEAEPEDRIVRITGAIIANVKVVTDTWQEVVGRRGMLETKEPGYRVKTVVYAGTPKEYTDGLEAAASEDYVLALQNLIFTLKKLDENTAFLKQYLYYHIALYYTKRGAEDDFGKARGYLEKLFAEVPEARLLPDALLLFADAWFLQGEQYEPALEAFRDAESKLKNMAQKVFDVEHTRYLDEKAYQAKFRQGECLLLLRRYPEAKNIFQAVKAEARNYPSVRLMAHLGMARALWQEERLDDAFKEFSDVVSDAEKAGIRDILAGAYAGLGDCRFQKNEPREALWNYLRVVVQYFDAAEYVPKALYRAALCWLKISEQDKAAEAKNLARAYLEEAVKKNAGFWSEEARKALNNL